MQVVFKINGREALPVRALSFVAGREPLIGTLRLPGHVVALAASQVPGLPECTALSLPTYQLVGGRPQAVLPTQWGIFLEQIENSGQLEYEATLLLPDGVFVWLDDFRAWFRRLQERPVTEDGAMPGAESYEITLHPVVPNEMRGAVLEGFLPSRANGLPIAGDEHSVLAGATARDASRIDYAPFCRVGEDGHIWWRLEDAYKLGAGYVPVCDDEQNLESVLVAPSPRVRANERELLASFHRGHPDIATARVLVRDDVHFVDALEFLDWLSQYLTRTQLGIAYPTELVRAVRDAVKAQRRQPLIDGQFESLVGALCEWFAKPLADLPKEQRGRVARDFPMPWDELSPDQRRSAAAQWDYQHDPATEQERNRAWDLVCRLDDVKREIREWELLKPNSITEKAEQANRLRDLHEKGRQLDAEIMDSEPQQDGHAPPAPPATEAATFISLHTVEQNTIQLKAIEQNTFNVTQYVIVQPAHPNSPRSDSEPTVPATHRQEARGESIQTPMKRSGILKQLGRRYQSLEGAMNRSEAWIKACRVPDKNGWYYLEPIEAECRARWGGAVAASSNGVPGMAEQLLAAK